MFKLRVSIENSISSQQIVFNVQLKDSKHKNISAGLSKCPLFQQLTTNVLRIDQRSYQGPEVYI